jgi:alkanesulfonate monooxygenase SsuD/methylene tetrahydromethanopterin reductase-like flavin-dependent oxidoreductase (luciferase family)
MHFGGAMFFTDYSMSAPELAQALEERGFESVWAPEHSHIPLSRKTPYPGGGDLPKPYYDAMDPFVVGRGRPGDQENQTRHRRGAHSAA